MDEFIPEGVALPFDDSIGPLLDESALELLERAPLYLITPTEIPLTDGATDLVKYDSDKAYIPVPDDYVRLYEIKYALWKNAVRKAITPEDPQYRVQDNEYLAPGYGRPMVAIVHKVFPQGAVTRYFECAEVLDPGQTVLAPTALYVKTCKPEELNDQLTTTLTNLCVSKVLISLGLLDRAKLAYEQYNLSIGILSP